LEKATLTITQIQADKDFITVNADHFNGIGYVLWSLSVNNEAYLVELLHSIGDPKGVIVYRTPNEIIDLQSAENTIVLTEHHVSAMQAVAVGLGPSGKTKNLMNEGGPWGITIEREETEEHTGLLLTYASSSCPQETFRFDPNNVGLLSIHKDVFSDPKRTKNFVTEVLMAPTTDGLEVPILVSYDTRFAKDGGAVLLVRAYGAYGSLDIPDFDKADAALMENGFVVARVGVRGSGALGMGWYVAGRVLHKRNSVVDLVNSVNFLQDHFAIPPDRSFGKGVSAGGLLLGAFINENPSLLRGAILDRPFLDVYGAMCDTSGFLTSMEYEEWGDPRIEAEKDTILTYSPLQHIQKQQYPALFLRASALDPITPAAVILRATYLYRSLASNKPWILCKVRPGEGHEVLYRLKEYAEEFAFMKHLVSLPTK